MLACIVATLVAWPAGVCAQTNSIGDATTDPAASRNDGSTSVRLNHRRIVTFRAELLSYSPQERADGARSAIAAALEAGGPGKVATTAAGEAVRVDIDGNTAFYLVRGDFGASAGVDLDEAASAVRRRLQLAVLESREMRDPVRLGKGFGFSLIASVLAYLLIRLLLRLRRAVASRLAARMAHWHDKLHVGGVATVRAEQIVGLAIRLNAALTWLIGLVTADIWLSFVLQQFAYTRPWGERSTEWLLGLLQDFVLAMAGAIPGLVVAILVFLIARFASRLNTAFLSRIEAGNARIGWLDADTAGPTRRIGNFVIWLFALAMAYPYLPGAHSEAFKGVSVLVGLMLSLGASSIVGQALSGFGLMYSRSLRPGEYVRVGDTEGTVTEVGMFSTKLHTGMGEEVSIPNTVVVGNPVRNFSRLAAEGAFLLHTTVTIGYATPWRQVHALLLEAARRTPGVTQDPVPYVVQTALSDFYVEYRLCAQSEMNVTGGRIEALNQLHANIQDLFNEHGVQIMSPHYMADPPRPQVVSPADWFAPPAMRQANPAADKP